MNTHSESVGSADRIEAAIDEICSKRNLDRGKLHDFAARAESYKRNWLGTIDDAIGNVFKSAMQGKTDSERKRLLPYRSALIAAYKEAGGVDGQKNPA